MTGILLTRKNIIFLYVAILLVYIAGLFVPLMENDSAQHASMAMKMALNNDFLNIYKGNEPYLDKPHLHFWLAALSMKLFGINHIAYRLPSVLFLFMAAWCTFKLTKKLYEDETVAHVSALIFLSAQTIILSAHDVRTDAILTGAVMLGIYNLVAYCKDQKTHHALLGGLGTTLALGSKGMVGVVIIGLCVLAYLLYSREWKQFFGWKISSVTLAFLLGISPFLYAYYYQYDLHPQLWVRGEQNVSGIRFILWDQSFKRFTADGFGERQMDYFFFFHSLLWMFIPFTAVLCGAIISRSAFFIKSAFRKTAGYEFLTIGGFWSIMLIFNFSKFKLPHYINSLIPVLAVLVASYLLQLVIKQRKKEIRVYLILQYVLAGIAILVIVLFGAFVFEKHHYTGWGLTIVALFFLLKEAFSKSDAVKKIICVGILTAVTLNLFLNTNFYPQLTQHQAGIQAAAFIKQNKIDPKDIIAPSDGERWTLDFYTATNIKRLPEEQLSGQKGKYLFMKRTQLETLKKSGLQYEELYTASQYHITKLNLGFMNPATRENKAVPFVLSRIE